LNNDRPYSIEVYDCANQQKIEVLRHSDPKPENQLLQKSILLMTKKHQASKWENQF